MANQNSPAVLDGHAPAERASKYSDSSASQPKTRRSRLGAWFDGLPDATLAAFLVIAVLVCYVNILGNSFVYDDEQQILQNPYVKDWHFLPQIFGTTVWSFVGQAGTTNYYRPLMTFSFLVLWKLFGPIPFGFHLFSLVMHAAVVVMLFYAGLRLFADRRIAWLSAMLFAVHPIHTEAVAWIASIPDLEATFFALLALWALAKPGPLGWKEQTVAFSSFALALLSKEPSLMLVPLAIAFEHGVRQGRQNATLARKLARYAPLAVLGVGYLSLRMALFGKLAPVLQHAQYSWPTAIYSGFGLTLGYARMLVWPAHLSAFHVFHASTSLLDPRVIGGIILVSLGALAVVLAWRRAPFVAFSILWIGVTLAPVLNARWMAANVQTERYLYLPSVGFCWLVAWCIVRLGASHRSLASGPTPTYRRLLRPALAIAFACAVTFSASATVARNTVWRTDFALYTRTLETDPDAAVIRSNLASIYFDRGDLGRAGREWELALAEKPDNVVTMNALGALYTKEQRYPEAEAILQRAINAKPLWANAHYNYGVLLQKTGQPERALQQFKIAVDVAPLDARAHYLYGNALLDAGNLPEAAAQLNHAVNRDASLEALQDLARVYSLSSQPVQAEAVLRRATKDFPLDSASHFQLADVLRAQKRYAEAKSEFQVGLKTDPTNAEAQQAIHEIDQRESSPLGSNP